MKPFLKKWLEKTLFVKDIKCIGCGAELGNPTHFCLCQSCLNKLPRNNGKTCDKCGEPIFSDAHYCLRCKQNKPVFTRCFSPLLYRYPVTHFIQDFKYNNRQYYAKTLGNFLVECYVLNNLSCDVVVPVPIHAKRLKQRGFNQAELLAKPLQEQLDISLRNDVLLKTKSNQTQTSLNATERKENVKNVFSVVDKKAVKGKVVLVVDDVFTTGATLNECAEVLFAAGAKQVYCMALAHTLTDRI